MDLAEAVINSSLDGILAFDRQCRFTLWNPAMERIAGINRDAVLAQCAFDIFPFLKETGEDACFHRTLAGQTVVSTDRPYRVPETGREGYYEACYSPLQGDTGEVTGGLVIVRETTERRQLEALDAAREFRPDVILLDIGLPEMDGYEVARRLSAGNLLKGVLLVAITGYGQEDDRKRSLEAGCAFHLTKPVAPEALRELLAGYGRATHSRA